MATEPKLADRIEVTETSVIVDGQEIGGWLYPDPVRIEAAENGAVRVTVTLTAREVVATVEPHPASTR